MQEEDKDRLYRSYLLERFSIHWEIENCFSDIPRKISFLLIVSIWALYLVLNQSIWPEKFDVPIGLGLD